MSNSGSSGDSEGSGSSGTSNKNSSESYSQSKETNQNGKCSENIMRIYSIYFYKLESLPIFFLFILDSLLFQIRSL